MDKSPAQQPRSGSNLKDELLRLLDAAKPGDSGSRRLDIFLITLIVLNLFAVVAESVSSLALRWEVFFYWFDIISVIIFTIEYACRLWVCTSLPRYAHPVTGRLRYVFSPMALVDLAAILPFYLMLVGADLRFVRAFRLFRALRIAKLGRYSSSVSLINNVLLAKKEELALTGFFMVMLVFVTSSLMYFVEHEAQPEGFPDIPSALWWGVVTLTTVGYGDVYPITTLGRLLAAALAILGVGFVALPAGILGAGFVSEIEKKKTSNTYERLDQTLAQVQRYHQQAAILVLDLDNFKPINDALGRSQGDQLLRAVLTRLKERLRKSDTVVPWDTDQFVGVLPGLSKPHDAVKVAESLLQTISDRFQVTSQDVSITASIGISLYPSDGVSLDELLKNSRVAAGLAKQLGKNTYHFYNQPVHEAVQKQLELEQQLKQGLENEELTIAYQPRISLDSGTISALEAVIHWAHPRWGTLGPSEFIPLAEEASLMEAVGEWSLRAVCRQNKEWQEAGLPCVPVILPLSSQHFRQKRLPQRVSAALGEVGLNPRYLGIEIDERLALDNPDHSALTLQALKKAGVRISLGSFGGNPTSLSHLQRLPIDQVKIPGPLLQGLPVDRNNLDLVSAIIAVARCWRWKTVGDQVRFPEQRECLRSLGCDEWQGSGPLPAGDIELGWQTQLVEPRVD